MILAAIAAIVIIAFVAYVVTAAYMIGYREGEINGLNEAIKEMESAKKNEI